MKAENVGYLLWCSVGTGKSYLAGYIANALMEQEISVCMTYFAAILNDLKNGFDDKGRKKKRSCQGWRDRFKEISNQMRISPIRRP